MRGFEADGFDDFQFPGSYAPFFSLQKNLG
jgi:hypothetical protein